MCPPQKNRGCNGSLPVGAFVLNELFRQASYLANVGVFHFIHDFRRYTVSVQSWKNDTIRMNFINRWQIRLVFFSVVLMTWLMTLRRVVCNRDPSPAFSQARNASRKWRHFSTFFLLDSVVRVHGLLCAWHFDYSVNWTARGGGGGTAVRVFERTGTIIHLIQSNERRWLIVGYSIQRQKNKETSTQQRHFRQAA